MISEIKFSTLYLNNSVTPVQAGKRFIHQGKAASIILFPVSLLYGNDTVYSNLLKEIFNYTIQKGENRWHFLQ